MNRRSFFTRGFPVGAAALALPACLQGDSELEEIAVQVPANPGPSVSEIPQGLRWQEAETIYQQAIAEGYRINGSGYDNVERWLEEASTWERQVDVLENWTLAEDGSYSDLVQIGIDDIARMYDNQIRSETNDRVRRHIFRQGVETLLRVYEVLDGQIKAYQDFRSEVIDAFEAFKSQYTSSTTGEDGEPLSGDDLEDEAWGVFLEQYPDIDKRWPGFHSTQVAVQRGDRSYDEYHKPERDALAASLVAVKEMDSLTLEQYEDSGTMQRFSRI